VPHPATATVGAAASTALNVNADGIMLRGYDPVAYCTDAAGMWRKKRDEHLAMAAQNWPSVKDRNGFDAM